MNYLQKDTISFKLEFMDVWSSGRKSIIVAKSIKQNHNLMKVSDGNSAELRNN